MKYDELKIIDIRNILDAQEKDFARTSPYTDGLSGMHKFMRHLCQHVKHLYEICKKIEKIYKDLECIKKMLEKERQGVKKKVNKKTKAKARVTVKASH